MYGHVNVKFEIITLNVSIPGVNLYELQWDIKNLK
jgi:hypothetical protein